jgi:hypothetical protein
MHKSEQKRLKLGQIHAGDPPQSEAAGTGLCGTALSGKSDGNGARLPALANIDPLSAWRTLRECFVLRDFPNSLQVERPQLHSLRGT